MSGQLNYLVHYRFDPPRMNKLQDVVTCAVCCEVFSQANPPKMLPCEHCLCHQCITSIYSRQAECPFCRAPFPDASQSIHIIKSVLDVVEVYYLQCQMGALEEANTSPIGERTAPMSVFPKEWHHRTETHSVCTSNNKYGVCLSTTGNHGSPGCSGHAGVNGVRGENGVNAEEGNHGQHGEPGMSGGDGTSGDNGEDGCNAEDISILLLNSGPTLSVYYSHDCLSVSMEDGLHVDCTGGNGGPGGAGGTGGNGGNGGNGGDGASHASIRGAGGNGGNGGNGGDGGDGGHGGRGGAGGKITIYSADAALFFLVETHFDGGKAGTLGRGGDAGTKGYAGVYGRGKAPPDGGEGIPSGKSGNVGIDGTRGKPGKNGLCGREGRPGSVTYVLYDAATGDILEKSDKLYQPVFDKFVVNPENDDGIVEPLETIVVHSIQIRNVGGMTLPKGMLISLRGKENFTILPERRCMAIIEEPIPPNHSVALQPKLFGAIGPCCQPATLSLQPSLLGKVFPGEMPYCIAKVEYPLYVHVDHVCIAHRGELSIRLKNQSTVSYGHDRREDVEIRLVPERGLRVVEYQERISSISPEESLTIKATVEFEDCVAFYERVPCKVFLFLRGEEVQRAAFMCTRAIEFDMEAPPADMLILATCRLTQEFYRSLNDVTRILQLSYQIWDTALYPSLTTHRDEAAPWINAYNGKLIILVTDRPFGMGLTKQLYGHFFPPEAAGPSYSSLLIVSPRQLARGMYQGLFGVEGLYSSTDLEMTEFAGWHVSPDVKPRKMHNRCAGIEREYHQENPDLLCRVFWVVFEPRKVPDVRRTVLLKQFWTYGEAQLRVSSFTRSCQAHICSPSAVTDPDQFLGVLAQVLPFRDVIPLLHSYHQLAHHSPLPVIRSILYSRLRALLLPTYHGDVKSVLEHIEEVIFRYLSVGQEQPFFARRAAHEFLALLYRLVEEFRPSTLSRNKRGQQERLKPFLDVIGTIEGLMTNPDEDLLRRLVFRRLDAYSPSCENFWQVTASN